MRVLCERELLKANTENNFVDGCKEGKISSFAKPLFGCVCATLRCLMPGLKGGGRTAPQEASEAALLLSGFRPPLPTRLGFHSKGHVLVITVPPPTH